MAFPISPVDGEIYTTAFGTRYRYYIADDKWVKDGFEQKGNTGIQGVTGIPGITGSQGVTGIAGITGLQSATGIQGQTGIQGLTGIQGTTGVNGITGLTGVTGAQGITGLRGATGLDIGITGTINIVIDGGGAVITTGVKADIRLPFAIAVESWNLVAKETGSILIGVWRDTYANFPPTSDKALHSGATGPNLIASIKNTAATTDWGQPTGAAGEYLRINVDSVATVQQVSLALNYRKT